MSNYFTSMFGSPQHSQQQGTPYSNNSSNPPDPLARQNKIADNLKQNFEGWYVCSIIFTLLTESLASPSLEDIKGILQTCGWDEVKAHPLVTKTYNDNRLRLYTSVYYDISEFEITRILQQGLSDDVSIQQLNIVRQQMTKHKEDTFEEERKYLEKKLQDSEEARNLDRQLYLESTTSHSKEIYDIKAENEKLSKKISKLKEWNSEIEERSNLFERLKNTAQSELKNLKDQLIEYQLGTFIRVPSQVDIGEEFQIKWRLSGSVSNSTDIIKLIDWEGQIISTYQIFEEGLSFGYVDFIAPKVYGEYHIVYCTIESTLFGMVSNENILCTSDNFLVGPKYIITEVSNITNDFDNTGTLRLKVTRPFGQQYFDKFNIGMYLIGADDSDFISNQVTLENNILDFKYDLDANLYNFEFRVFGHHSDSVLVKVCTQGHVSFSRKENNKKRRTIYEEIYGTISIEDDDSKSSNNNNNNNNNNKKQKIIVEGIEEDNNDEDIIISSSDSDGEYKEIGDLVEEENSDVGSSNDDDII